MDRISDVLRCQWRAYWRRFRGAGSLKASNAGVLLLVGGLGAVRYVQQLPLAATQLSKGETARYETLLLVVFLAWFAALMGESSRSITSRSLLHFPLSVRDLLLIRTISISYSPVIWVIAAASLALGFVASAGQHPIAGLLALLAFVLFALFAGLILSHLLNSAGARKLILAVLLLISAVAALLWLGRQTDAAAMLRSLTPARLTVAAAISSNPFSSLAILLAITIAAALLVIVTVPLSLQPQQSRRSKTALLAQLPFPGKLGGLVRKDLKYTSRLLDLYLALPVVIFFNIYLVSDTAPSAVIFSLLIGALFLTCSSIAFNCFGLDSATGWDRYTLFPLSGEEKLAGKNLAFAVVMIALFLTMLPHAFWRLGVRASLLGTIELIVAWLAYVSYGNWLSVKQPFKMQFYRFASGGSPVDALMGMIFGSIPVGVSVLLVHREGGAVFWQFGVMLLIYVAIYFLTLTYSARVLERKQENIRRALS